MTPPHQPRPVPHPPHSNRTKKLLCPGLKPVREVCRTPYFRLMERGSYFTLEYDFPQVVILPVVENRNVVLVRPFRPIIGDAPLELPAGGAEAGETPRRAARRELREETGIDIRELSRFRAQKPLVETPGRIPFALAVFRIDLTREEWKRRKKYDGEIFSVRLFSPERLKRELLSGRLYLSSPAAIISRFLLELADKSD